MYLRPQLHDNELDCPDIEFNGFTFTLKNCDNTVGQNKTKTVKGVNWVR
jgi:hypothetical protein